MRIANHREPMIFALIWIAFIGAALGGGAYAWWHKYGAEADPSLGAYILLLALGGLVGGYLRILDSYFRAIRQGIGSTPWFQESIVLLVMGAITGLIVSVVVVTLCHLFVTIQGPRWLGLLGLAVVAGAFARSLADWQSGVSR